MIHFYKCASCYFEGEHDLVQKSQGLVNFHRDFHKLQAASLPPTGTFYTQDSPWTFGPTIRVDSPKSERIAMAFLVVGPTLSWQLGISHDM